MTARVQGISATAASRRIAGARSGDNEVDARVHATLSREDGLFVLSVGQLISDERRDRRAELKSAEDALKRELLPRIEELEGRRRDLRFGFDRDAAMGEDVPDFLSRKHCQTFGRIKTSKLPPDARQSARSGRYEALNSDDVIISGRNSLGRP